MDVELVQNPVAANSTSPWRGVPEMFGGWTLTGAAFPAPLAAAPPARSATATTTATCFHMAQVSPPRDRPNGAQTECLRAHDRRYHPS